MFKKFKDNIMDIAFSAVYYAENALSAASGKEKKRAAIAFLVEKLSLPYPIRPIVTILFSNFIDKAIEKAVDYMNQVKNED